MSWVCTLFLAGCPETDGGSGDPDPTWFTTCGDPVCGGYSGPFDGVDVCADQTTGQGCDELGAECDLETDCNTFLICAVYDPKGTDLYGCPISLREAKKDIRYLDDPELAAMADEALRLDLATWNYRQEPDGGRRHLGFVIDDRPASPAVAADGRHVDLYGYATLAIAALQVQQAEIDALRAELHCAPHRVSGRRGRRGRA
jgi:hypothetical protein